MVSSARPKLQTFMRYAKVELVPPTPAELGEASQALAKGINTIRSGKWQSFTVRVSLFSVIHLFFIFFFILTSSRFQNSKLKL